MFSKTLAALAIALQILATPPAHAAGFETGNFSAPPVMRFMVTRGQSNDGSFTDRQLVAYIVAFGSALDAQWPDRLPETVKEKGPSLFAGAAMGEGDVNPFLIAGTDDGALFARQVSPESPEAQSAIAIVTYVFNQ